MEKSNEITENYWKERLDIFLSKLSNDKKDDFENMFKTLDAKITDEYVIDDNEEIPKYKYILQKLTIHKLLNY